MNKQQHSRLDRMASTVKRILARPVDDIARAEKIGLVSITRIDVSPDLRRATVFVSAYGGPDDAGAGQAVAKLLAAHAAQLQRELGQQLRTRRTPVLDFRGDANLAHGDVIDRLLDRGRDGSEPE